MLQPIVAPETCAGRFGNLCWTLWKPVLEALETCVGPTIMQDYEVCYITGHCERVLLWYLHYSLSPLKLQLPPYQIALEYDHPNMSFLLEHQWLPLVTRMLLIGNSSQCRNPLWS